MHLGVLGLNNMKQSARQTFSAVKQIRYYTKFLLLIERRLDSGSLRVSLGVRITPLALVNKCCFTMQENPSSVS